MSSLGSSAHLLRKNQYQGAVSAKPMGLRGEFSNTWHANLIADSLRRKES